MINLKNKLKNLFKQEGYIVSIITLFVLIIMLSFAITMSFTIAFRQKTATNNVKSTQSYYAAEAGVEDALLKLRSNPQMPLTSYSLSVNGATAQVTIPNIIAGSRAVASKGNNTGMIKNMQATYSIDSQSISFHYGAQVGQGGLTMNNGSRIIGNVSSAGNISGSGTIDDNVVVSGNGKSIQGVYVGGDVLAYSCLSSANVRNLTYVTGGIHTCTVRGTTSVQSQEIAEQQLPISQTQIDDWKSEATSASVITGNVIVTNGQTRILGPVKITGSLNVNNGATLKITGTIYVVGNISISNNSIIKLDSSFGSLGGVLMSDGTINIANNNTFLGSGQTGSYVLVLSNSTSNSAISLSNNTSGAVFYTSEGGLSISNNVSVVEAIGYKIIMSNNSTIIYDSGIINVFFSSGPGGSWKVTSWGEK